MKGVIRYALKAFDRWGQCLDTWVYNDPREAEANVAAMSLAHAAVPELRIRLTQV